MFSDSSMPVAGACNTSVPYIDGIYISGNSSNNGFFVLTGTTTTTSSRRSSCPSATSATATGDNKNIYRACDDRGIH